MCAVDHGVHKRREMRERNASDVLGVTFNSWPRAVIGDSASLGRLDGGSKSDVNS